MSASPSRPSPLRKRWSASKALLFASALVIIVAGLRVASAIVVPVLLSLFISIIFTRPLQSLERRFGFAVSFTSVMFVLVLLFVTVPILIGGSLQQVLRLLPELQQQLSIWAVRGSERLEAWGWGIAGEDLSQVLDPVWGTSLLGGFLNGLLRAFKDGVVVLIMTGFMLAETTWFAEKLNLIDGGSGEMHQKIVQIAVNARRYLVIKTWMSLGTGAVVWLGMHLLGIEFAPVWGFLAFLLNYIPIIGSIIAGVPPVALALVQEGAGVAIAVAVCFLVVNQVFGSILEPRLQGLGLGLSPLIVFISLIFWGWVLGPIGMLLSAPLTMLLRIACEEFPETRWIGILLAGRPKPRVCQ